MCEDSKLHDQWYWLMVRHKDEAEKLAKETKNLEEQIEGLSERVAELESEIDDRKAYERELLDAIEEAEHPELLRREDPESTDEF